jgi:hypothetical protein
MIDGRFHLVRRTNERPNTQFNIVITKDSLSGSTFPSLLQYLSSNRKTVIHCHSMDVLWRVYIYLWRCLQSSGAHRLKRIRMYHGLLPAEYNVETLTLMETDPDFQVIVSTIAIANGINARSLLDSLSQGFGSTVGEMRQREGRVARDPDTVGRSVIFVSAAAITLATKLLNGKIKFSLRQLSHKFWLVGEPARRQRQKTTAHIAKPPKPPSTEDLLKATVLAEKVCYIAAINRVFQNPPTEITYLDCVAAGRTLPCSLCLVRAPRRLEFPPSPRPSGAAPLPAFIDISTATLPNRRPKLKLTKKERPMLEAKLLEFGQRVRRAECYLNLANRYRPATAYFPSPLSSAILDHFFQLLSLSDLTAQTTGWIFASKHNDSLFALITDLQNLIKSERASKKKAASKTTVTRKRSAAVLSDSTDEDMVAVSEGGMESEEEMDAEEMVAQVEDPLPPTRVLTDVTNRPPKSPRVVRTTQPSAASVAEEYGPKYRTTRGTRNLKRRD